MTVESNSEISNGEDQSGAALADKAQATATGIEAEGFEPKGSSAAVDALKKQAEIRQAHMKQAMQSKMLSANFGNIVTMFLQSPGHKHLKLEDLPARIIMPLVNNQFLLAEAYKKDTGFTFPVGVVLWASVSDEVEQRLSQDLNEPILLTQDEWTGGDNYWLIESIGEQRFVQQLLGRLCKEVFKDKPFKARVADKDGKRRIEVLNTGE